MVNIFYAANKYMHAGSKLNCFNRAVKFDLPCCDLESILVTVVLVTFVMYSKGGCKVKLT